MNFAPTHRRTRLWGVPWIGSLVAALLGSGCGKECLDNNAFYEQRVWTQVISQSCIKCHAPEGVAASQNAKFLQLSQSYPGFLELNVANISEIAKIQYEGKSELLLKPLGQLNHGGGPVLDEDSDEYKILEEMVERASSPVSCGEKGQSAAVSHLDLLEPVETLRKATLDLVGRLPTSAEFEAVKEGGEDALSAQLDKLMTESAFYDRLKEIYAEVLLTGRYANNGLGLVDGTDFPSRTWFNPTNLPTNMWTDEMRSQSRWSEYGIGAEPLELIAYVAKNDKPFTEILTADYTVVNYYSAKVYGIDPAPLGLNLGDYYTFRPAKLSVMRGGKQTPVAHAGVLTTPVWLNRYPTTTTNVNRARARFTFKYFLATDLLAVAERPIDPSSVTSTNPTRDDKYCVPCHKVIDPVASTYQKFDANGRFQPTLDWPTAMPQPGFANQVLDNVQQYPNALQWLAGKMTQDARFNVSVLNNIYRSLIGTVPVPYPSADDPQFSEHQAAWQEQNRIFQEILASFESGNKNVKLIFKGLIMSPIYRATNAHDLDPATAEAFGTGRLRTPELLARELPATMGFRWARYDRQDVLTTDYNLLYGGIDGNNVISRLTTPNGIMANIGKRMSNDMACQAVAWDFSRKQVDRQLFRYVEISHAPEDDNGFPVPASIDNIKRNLQHLHMLLAGEALAVDDPEIERTYTLFLETWRELHTSKNTNLNYGCQGRWDRVTGMQIPDAQVTIGNDKYFTVRSWMAVITYLMTDWKYLYE